MAAAPAVDLPGPTDRAWAGKLLIRPTHVPAANRVSTTTPEEAARAHRILAPGTLGDRMRAIGR